MKTVLAIGPHRMIEECKPLARKNGIAIKEANEPEKVYGFRGTVLLFYNWGWSNTVNHDGAWNYLQLHCKFIKVENFDDVIDQLKKEEVNV